MKNNKKNDILKIDKFVKEILAKNPDDELTIELHIDFLKQEIEDLIIENESLKSKILNKSVLKTQEKINDELQKNQILNHKVKNKY